MQAEEQGERPSPLSPPLGEVASHGAACGVRWRRLPRLTEAQLREQLLEGEGEGGKREGNKNGGRRRESVPLHARLDGRLVPTTTPDLSSSSSALASAPSAARLDRAHAAVVDNFVSEGSRAELLSLVVFGRRREREREEEEGESEGGGREERGRNRNCYDELSGSDGLPRPRWERRTADSAEAAAADAALGWGLSSQALEDLLDLASPSFSTLSPSLLSPPPRAFAEVGSKLSAMFPEHDCLWLPTGSMEGRKKKKKERSGRDEEEEDDGDDKGNETSATSPPLLVNAALPSDAFSYHVDCDPDSTQPGTPWHDAFGHFVNGEADKPLLVSVVLYLNDSWQPSFAGETLVMDSTAAVGCAVLPKPGRALLIESDVLHKLCPPSVSCSNRLRFSLVLKLALCPRKRISTSSLPSKNVLSREWWGPPADVGSAKALSELVRRVGEEKKRKRGEREGQGKEEDEQMSGEGRAN